MSAHVKSPGAARLRLVRGGLDAHAPSAADVEWQAFCARIGWRESTAPLADDYEEKLAERIARGRGVGQRGERLDVSREPRTANADWMAGAVAQGIGSPWPRQGQDAGRVLLLGPRARAALWAAAGAAVAAAACFAFISIWSWAAHSAASATPTRELPQPAPIVSPPAPVEAVTPVDSSAPLAPSEPSHPPELAPNPGALVARVDQRHGAKGARSRARATAGASPVAREETPGARRVAPPTAPAADFESPEPPAARVALMLRAESRELVAVPAVTPWASMAGELGRPAPAAVSWAVSPANERWYGVALPPAGDPTNAPAGVGVMAQLDVTRALSRL